MVVVDDARISLLADNDDVVAEDEEELRRVIADGRKKDGEFCEGIDSAADYVTISSYGDDFDFYGSSGAVIPGGQPVFTRRVLFFALTTILVRPACCAAFLVYGRLTGDYRLFESCLAITLLFYATLLIETCIMYANVRTDKMPMGRCERWLVAFLEISLPAAFVCSASAVIFGDPVFFDRAIKYPRNERYGDSIDALTAGAVLMYLAYSVLSVTDAMAFVFPRLWVMAVTKTSIPF